MKKKKSLKNTGLRSFNTLSQEDLIGFIMQQCSVGTEIDLEKLLGITGILAHIAFDLAPQCPHCQEEHQENQAREFQVGNIIFSQILEENEEPELPSDLIN